MGGDSPARRTAADSNGLPTKTYKPIASVAALTAQPLAALPPYGCGVPFTGGERHAGWHYLRHKFIGARPPSLSFRGAKRRGNLAEPGWITWYSRRKRNCLPEIATSAVGLLAMTNLGALLDRRACLQICSCHRRSLSAATDAIGAYHFNGGLCESAVPSRDCHGRKAPSQ